VVIRLGPATVALLCLFLLLGPTLLWAQRPDPPDDASDVATVADPAEEPSIFTRQSAPPPVSDGFVPTEVIVKFKPGVSATKRALTVTQEGAVLLRHLLVPGYALVRVPPGQEEEFVTRLEANPWVEVAERNLTKRVTFTPNDTYYSYQWHMPQVQMEQAWDVANGSGVVVAVIDTGVAYEDYGSFAQAADLAGTSFTAGYDFVNDDAHPNDDNGHGTHVAGTVAQSTNNSLGVAGVAYGSTIMPIKVCDSEGSCPVAAIVDGITWATDQGADVINLSLGGSYSPAEETAVNYALSNGVVVVAAAGNSGVSTLDCPACYPGVIAVAATDYNQDRAPYSSYGCGRDGHCLDVVAPGGDTTADENNDGYADGVLQQTYDFACGGGPPDFTAFVYCFFQGTSMASPHVAGAAVLLLDANPSLTREQVGDCLRNTALDRGAPGYDTEYGYGLIQVSDALDSCGLEPDSDGDGVPDPDDNCPSVYNPDQADWDGDGQGDACDEDDDDDSFADVAELHVGTDTLDDCPDVVAPESGAQCGNGLDDDGDTRVDDGCPPVGPAESGDQCENAVDDDGDTVVNDGCPAFAGDDAWPPDIYIDRSVDVVDVAFYKGMLGYCQSEPEFNPRYDLDVLPSPACSPEEPRVDILDVALYKPLLGTSCTNP
jgi:serine protease